MKSDDDELIVSSQFVMQVAVRAYFFHHRDEKVHLQFIDKNGTVVELHLDYGLSANECEWWGVSRWLR